MPRKRKLLVVDFIDITTNDRWHRETDRVAHKPLYCQAIGTLLEEDKHVLVLAAMAALQAGGCCDRALTITIPKGCIVQKKTIRVEDLL